jgi:hypothetical protein
MFGRLRRQCEYMLRSEVDETGSGLCPMAGFHISSTESFGFATRVFYLKKVE